MKLCITSEGRDLSAAVDPRFGRARFFIIYDGHTGEFEPLDNKQNMNSASGAGVQAATNVVEAGAQVVLTGHCGPRAFDVLEAGDVKVAVGAEGTVEQAIRAWRDGELSPVENADVKPHW
jgi:predicted Fe-Mo cluster-binding NifX family protein